MAEHHEAAPSHDSSPKKGSTHGLPGDFSAQNVVNGMTDAFIVPLIDLSLKAITETGDELMPLGAKHKGGKAGH